MVKNRAKKQILNRKKSKDLLSYLHTKNAKYDNQIECNLLFCLAEELALNRIERQTNKI